jgi:hypothetical protein
MKVVTALVCTILGAGAACWWMGGPGNPTASWSPEAVLFFGGSVLVGSAVGGWKLGPQLQGALRRYSAWCAKSYKDPQP